MCVLHSNQLEVIVDGVKYLAAWLFEPNNKSGRELRDTLLGLANSYSLCKKLMHDVDHDNTGKRQKRTNFSRGCALVCSLEAPGGLWNTETSAFCWSQARSSSTSFCPGTSRLTSSCTPSTTTNS